MRVFLLCRRLLMAREQHVQTLATSLLLQTTFWEKPTAPHLAALSMAEGGDLAAPREALTQTSLGVAAIR